jgi:hypothetical protein
MHTNIKFPFKALVVIMRTTYFNALKLRSEYRLHLCPSYGSKSEQRLCLHAVNRDMILFLQLYCVSCEVRTECL